MIERNDHFRWVIGVLLSIIFVSSLLLYFNLTKKSGQNENPEIGTLVFKRKTIERKFDSDVIWDKIESGLKIHNKDTIRSGDYSDAVLTLKDETKININENSMIYLDLSDDSLNLNFAYGSLSLDQNRNVNSEIKTFKVSSGTAVLDLKDTKITIEKKGKEDLKFHVKEGNVKLTDGNKEKEIKTNETVSLKNKEIIVSEINLNLISPEDSSVVTGKTKSIPVNFTWNVKNAGKLKLELSRNSRFTDILKSYKVSGESLNVSLESGVYYWRLGSEGKGGPADYSPYRKLIVMSSSPPAIQYPKNNQVFSYVSVVPMIDFSWNRIEAAKYYTLELSKSSGFSEITKSLTTANTHVSIDKLEPGKYFARLGFEPISKEVQKENSEVISFSIELKTQVDPPTIISNTNAQEFVKENYNKTGVLLQVKDSPEITGYTFQISDSKDFSKIIKEETTPINNYKLTAKLEEGEYYWRASGITRDGKRTQYSNAGKFRIKEQKEIVEVPDVLPISPAKNSSVDMSDLDVLSFKWELNPKIEEFEFELYQDKKGKDELIVKQKVKGNSYILRDLSKLDVGKFHWTIRGYAGQDGSLKPGAKAEIPFKILLSEKTEVPEIETSKKIYVE